MTATVQPPSRLCPHCAQPFTAGRHNQRFCDALCKRWYGKWRSRLRRQEMARSERTAAGGAEMVTQGRTVEGVCVVCGVTTRGTRALAPRLCQPCSSRAKLASVSIRGGRARARNADQWLWDDLTPTEQKDLVRRYLAGESGERLGSAFGVTGQTVRAWLKRIGVPIRERGWTREGVSASR